MTSLGMTPSTSELPWNFEVLLLNSDYAPAQINDTRRERLMFHSIQYRNGWLAASDLFDIFTQSIKFYTFHYQYRCLKNVIHQIDSKNRWLLLSVSFTAKFGLVFVLTILTWKNLCFTEKIHWNTRLAASSIFHMFTQSIKFL